MKKALVVLVAVVALIALAACASGASPGAASAGGAPSAASGSAPASASSSAAPSSPSAASPAGGVLPESEWGSLLPTMGDEYVAFGRRVQGELPVRAYACYQGEGGGDPIWYDDAATVEALFNALAAANATEDTGEVRSDDYMSFGFEFADGSRTSFMFDSMTFMVAEGNIWKVYGLDYDFDLSTFADRAAEVGYAGSDFADDKGLLTLLVLDAPIQVTARKGGSGLSASACSIRCLAPDGACAGL